MFKIFLVNSGFFIHGEFDTIEGALARAKNSTFQCTIYNVVKVSEDHTVETMVATYCPFNGIKYL